MGAIRPTSLETFIGQADAVNILQIAVLSAKRQQRTLGHVLLTGSGGLGKCLGAGTSVLLADGRVVPVEAVGLGERLMGMDGTARTVLSLSTGRSTLYRITPVKGVPWVCNAEHVLSLIESKPGGTVVDIPLKRWQSASNKFREEHKQFSVGVELFENAPAARPIDPYFLGVWFGDGTKEVFDNQLRRVVITKPDKEIREICEQVAAQWGLSAKVYNTYGCPSYSLAGERTGTPLGANQLLTAMRELLGSELSIPKSYLYAPRRERLEFLAGLLDTDGELADGCYVITQKREDWARDIWWLARSLGFSASIRTRIGRCPRPDGSVFQGIYWVVGINGHINQIPLRIPRKKASPRRQRKSAVNTGFSVSEIGIGDYYGFTLDGDGRFLLGDFTVTHNSSLAMSVLPKELGVTASFINCAAIEKPQDITSVLAKAREGTIVFLDELHALIPAAREHLLTAMEDQQLNVRIDGLNGKDAQIMVVKLPPFTIIGATTRTGQLDGPLRSRFVHQLALQPYTEVELAEIAIWHGKARGISFEPAAAALLGDSAHGMARMAVNLVEASIDTLYGVYKTEGTTITERMAQETLTRLGYKNGVAPAQLRYMEVLMKHSVLGLKTLSGLLGETEQTIEEVIEPWLLLKGYIERTSAGRKAVKTYMRKVGT